MSSKRTVLTLVAYYLPGYKSGGPVRTIANMVEQLGGDLSFQIVTSNRDFSDAAPYPGVVVDDWNTVGNATVCYVTPGRWSFRRFVRLIRETPHDILYLNSFFDPVFTLYPLIARRLGMIPKRPLILAPRGEFSPGALVLKPVKKRLYMLVARLFGLYRDIIWQASSGLEAEDIRNAMGRVAEDIVVAPDLPGRSDEFSAVGKNARLSGAPLRICFLSRIDPKKNLDYALRVLSHVTVPVQFDLYGVIAQGKYWRDCQELLKRLPSFVHVWYHGVINHADVPRVLAGYDLFFFPTRGENFGHVIYEALSAGLPVLISDQTSWKGLDATGAGWELPLDDPGKFREVIESVAAMDDEVLAARRQAAKEYAKRVAVDEKVISANLQLFTEGMLDKTESR